MSVEEEEEEEVVSEEGMCLACVLQGGAAWPLASPRATHTDALHVQTGAPFVMALTC